MALIRPHQKASRSTTPTYPIILLLGVMPPSAAALTQMCHIIPAMFIHSLTAAILLTLRFPDLRAYYMQEWYLGS